LGFFRGRGKKWESRYGQRTAKDIDFDNSWKSILKAKATSEYIWPKGKTEEEKGKYALAYVRKSVEELSYLSPEMIQFMEGIAEGAAEELNKCTYANVCSNFEKIAMINYGSDYHPGPLPEKDDCCGFWVKDGATTGGTFASRTSQGIFPKSGGRTASYVAIPKDPNARVFWSNSTPGVLSGKAAALNDRGVCYLLAGAQYGEASAQPDETMAPGIACSTLAFYAVVFSKTAREAADRATIGTPKYRALSGRKTVLRRRGMTLAFADASECYNVEANARHYAIRRPGYLGEKGGNYLVFSNHYIYKDGSYNENNVWNANEPMHAYTKSQDVRGAKAPLPNTTYTGTSYWRFWSGMWMLHNNYGKIDKEMVFQELVPSHIGYDEDGRRYNPDENGVPTICNTFCDHYITPSDHKGYRTKEEPLGIGGNRSTYAFIPDRLEAYWVAGWPCHFKDKAWNYINLKPFSEYRKLLWGY
jgi:hypothetical protein